ncbi:MAG: AraC family transcriptional regulator [Pedobacter sp.]|nr:AraC family transcriptional regulator [Pedobacter sp.]MDQ8053738.1 AraC family transcriptional regulator [Pedobacter sp.]
MEHIRHLSNGNKMVSYTTRQAVNLVEEDSYCMKFVFTGKEECIAKNRKLNIYPDSFAVFPKDTSYLSQINSEIPVECFSLMYQHDFLAAFHYAETADLLQSLDSPFQQSSGYLFEGCTFPLHHDLKTNVIQLKAKLGAEDECELLINEYMHQCLLSYYATYQREVVHRYEKLGFVKKKTRLEIMRRLALAKEFICNNYDRNISLNEIAQASCLSTNHLLRRFKEAYGLSPFNFLVGYRLTRARQLLKDSSYSVKDIVGMVGFECPSSFSRLFKKTYQIQPLDFRKSSQTV